MKIKKQKIGIMLFLAGVGILVVSLYWQAHMHKVLGCDGNAINKYNHSSNNALSWADLLAAPIFIYIGSYLSIDKKSRLLKLTLSFFILVVVGIIYSFASLPSSCIGA
jgi:hypothetical protein